jgi:signal transduction histidine kinase
VKGSGLGLYIARTLMRMMDGDIFVRILPSEKENHTGDFAVTLVVRKA